MYRRAIDSGAQRPRRRWFDRAALDALAQGVLMMFCNSRTKRDSAFTRAVGAKLLTDGERLLERSAVARGKRRLWP